MSGHSADSQKIVQPKPNSSRTPSHGKIYAYLKPGSHYGSLQNIWLYK